MVFLKGQRNQSGNVPNVWTVDSEYGWDGTLSDAHWNGSSAGRLLTGITDAEGRTVTYAYDNRDRTTKTTETVTDGNGGSHEASITYQYEKDRLSAIGHNGFFYTFTYDAYGKKTGTAAGGNTILTETYQPANGSVTSQAYANGDTVSYAYNAREELENISHNGTKAFMYQYDAGGNRTEERIYPYTTGTLGEPETTISYGYGAEGWKDQLTEYDGQTITYDAIGNPLSYRDGMVLGWQRP